MVSVTEIITYGREAIERIICKYFKDSKIEKILFLPSEEDVKAKYIIGRVGFIRISNTWSGIVVVDGVQIPFVAEVHLNGKIDIYLYPQKDFYLAHLVGELNG
ncbi:putative protein DUF5461 [Saccharolobus shibatae B12]|uniref:Uncharacterized protein C-102b n=2 Tax=root TaxID=1 RepID=C102B_SSV1|nr:hypothetical protein [Saccharolobus shibatae]NP_039806.1 ORF C-102 [Sulfolobus spindle-shaped virus 1]P20207.1 RecName: Full=Uncharacterized protein C-102b [Sulfolobus spindle-shaped virus 1]QXJ30255.1 putative protein DUF5461 [Saccharolobus shibatae B12]CAA30208.1 ORF C-102 [Sulfolobus spindle-shaped virus 1]